MIQQAEPGRTISPELSVVICSLNGAFGVARCLRALCAQTISSELQLIVIDDGSTDDTSEVGQRHAATVVRHETNLGLAAARNSGVDVAAAPVVAFLDDDCEPEPQWAEQLLAGYGEGVIGVGGPVLSGPSNGFILGYLQRNSPLKPVESNIAKSDKLLYRLYLYLGRQWKSPEKNVARSVYSLVGANMSFRREALIDVGRFDRRFRFGGEDVDLCIRLRRAIPSGQLRFAPDARVLHHFVPSINDTLRRSRAYGRGSARLRRKWPSLPPTLFPGPLVVLTLMLMSFLSPMCGVAAVAVPCLLYPRGLRDAITSRSHASLFDGYVQLAQETFENIGFLEGMWRFRHLAAESKLAGAPEHGEGTGMVS
jgi:GT2 family glycosyltransferase